MFGDLDYWEEYYSRNGEVDIVFDNPSDFARFVINKLPDTHKNIIELGCGNGRDSIFFTKNNKNILAIDQCVNTTNELNKISENIQSFAADFTKLPLELDFKPDVVYSRFTLHSIDEEAEDRTLKWVAGILDKGGVFCLEARTVLDPLCGQGQNKGRNVWFTDHYRRFIVADEIE